ncbi:hypothetical protein [Metallosphaera javensis (ex Sakai et al. 2022)]|uniref:hypothetical protein n=1 Tax=Metallosphaera javensis (ex Sakai et al. 2022) TaxID=2775498 RepID=UPI00258F5128|nr:MAG: hypothetical protein MjAS7_0090 [Metallosphaera javensis (ex Sakai et al. 2022)]
MKAYNAGSLYFPTQQYGVAPVVDYKGHGRRYFFSTDTSTPEEEIMTTWENRWDVEVIIRG